MKTGPWAGLAQSRKFLLLVMDVIGSLALYFVTKYAGASLVDDVKFVLLALQPVFIMMIYAIAKEDAAEKANGFRWSDMGRLDTMVDDSE